MKQHWLITAFEPFAGRAENNSKHVIDEMKQIIAADENPDAWNYQFHYAVLPVVYATCFAALEDEVKALKKKGIQLSGVLAIGEGFEEFKVETQAHNVDDVPNFKDNAGDARADQVIFKDLPKDAILPLRFPIEPFSRIRKSTHAGFFICNHLCAEMSKNWINSPEIPYFGFIHVPKVGEGGVFSFDVCASMIVNGFRKLKV